MPRNPLAVGRLTTAALIAEARLAEAPISPAARVAGARAIGAAMTPAERAAMAERNAFLMSSAEMRVRASTIAVFGPQAPTEAELNEAEQRSATAGAVRHSCPRCGAEARGRTDEARADWFGDHYSRAHGGY